MTFWGFQYFDTTVDHRLKNGGVTIHETTKPRSDGRPVVLEHFTSMLNSRVPWWTDCDFPADCSLELDEQ
eukprot:2914703-Amphidinium_carterae.1